MLNRIVTIFLTTLFLLFIAAPTIVVMVDDSIDVSIVFSTSEEEKESESERLIDVKFLLHPEKTNEIELVFNSTKNNLGYFFKNYSKPHLNLISPPPDFI